MRLSKVTPSDFGVMLYGTGSILCKVMGGLGGIFPGIWCDEGKS